MKIEVYSTESSGIPQVFGRARQQLGEILSAFEFLDKHALDLTLGVLKDSVKNPLPASHTPFYLLIETAGGNREHDHAKLQVGIPLLLCLFDILSRDSIQIAI